MAKFVTDVPPRCSRDRRGSCSQSAQHANSGEAIWFRFEDFEPAFRNWPWRCRWPVFSLIRPGIAGQGMPARNRERLLRLGGPREAATASARVPANPSTLLANPHSCSQPQHGPASGRARRRMAFARLRDSCGEAVARIAGSLIEVIVGNRSSSLPPKDETAQDISEQRRRVFTSLGDSVQFSA